jgi:hypothetical protein
MRGTTRVVGVGRTVARLNVAGLMKLRQWSYF